jgi:hypothetical protein
MSNNLPTTEEIRERFIPISRREIVADLLAAPHWSHDEQQQFDEFCKIFTALYHYKFHARLEELKRCYTPFNPDTDIETKRDDSKEEKQELRNKLYQEMRQLLNNANYEELSIDDINKAMEADSFYGVSVSVDLEDYEKLIVYYRGSAIETKYKRNWKTLFLSKETLEIPIYKRMFLLLKFKTEEELAQKRVEKWLAEKEAEKQGETGQIDEEKKAKLKLKLEKKAKRQIQKSRQNLPEDLTEEHAFLKLFKNIPRYDLGMLFPNQNVQLKLFDKIKLAITGGGGTIGGIVSVAIKLAAANLLMVVGAIFGLIGIIVRQIMSIFTQRTKYMMTLSRNLYFHNLDNNFGVMNYLIDMAEEEEGKEAILAYYFLHSKRDKNYTQEELDREIESYIQKKYGIAVDYEVDDGLRKLREEGILIEREGILKVLDLHQACSCLDKQWDAFFNPDEEQ